MNGKNTRIYLAKNIKLDKSYKAVLNYSESQMLDLITNPSNLVYMNNRYSFIRETNSIIVEAPYSVCIQANYMAFQNKDYTNKYFFAFIDDVVYKGENNTEIIYTVDVWTTWHDYWNPKACFVIREHVTDDTVGKHTIDEGLYLGELINNSVDSTSDYSAHAIVATTYDILDNSSYSNRYNGIWSGLCYYLCGDFTSASFIDGAISILENAGKIDALSSIFMAPDILTGYVNNSSSDFWSWLESGGLRYRSYHKISNSGSATLMETKTISKNTTLNGYTPKNNKLKCWPFNFLSIDNNAGQCFTYNYELFSTTNCVFDLKGCITPGCSTRLIPKNYRGVTENNSEGINGGKYPICSWTTDVYINWLTQNGINIPGTSIKLNATEAGIASGVLTSLLGAGTMMLGNPMGVAGVFGGANQILGALKQDYQQSMNPPQIEGNINSGDVTYASGHLKFTFYKKSIRKEVAEVIDQYFTRMGYKVNTIKVPNMSRRENYNFVQVSGDENVAYSNNHNNICIPDKPLTEINALFRNGITIWNNHENFGDYSVSNNITA